MVFLSIGLLGLAPGAVGFGVGGAAGVAVASVIVLGCLCALSPVLGAAVARTRDEERAAHSS